MMFVSTELSWSLNPGDGSQLTTNVKRFVNSKSRVAFMCTEFYNLGKFS